MFSVSFLHCDMLKLISQNVFSSFRQQRRSGKKKNVRSYFHGGCIIKLQLWSEMRKLSPDHVSSWNVGHRKVFCLRGITICIINVPLLYNINYHSEYFLSSTRAKWIFTPPLCICLWLLSSLPHTPCGILARAVDRKSSEDKQNYWRRREREVLKSAVILTAGNDLTQ